MNCYIFDIDGVIADLETKEVTQKQTIKIIGKLLESQTPIAFISGRSTVWIVKNIVEEVRGELKDEKFLDNLLILGEFGSAYAHYRNSKIFSVFDDRLSAGLTDQAARITQKYSSVVKVDETKLTQFSSEMKDNLDIEKDFKPVQKKLVEEYKDLVRKMGLENELEVTEDKIGTNIKSKSSNKGNAIKVLLTWTAQRGFKINKFIVFGDSPSDVEMGEALRKNGLSVEFVFVGDEKIPNEPFPIHKTEEKFEKGTLEYLTRLNFKQN